MDALLALPNLPAVLALAILALMFVFFVAEIYPPEIVAMAGAAAMLVVGAMPAGEVLDVLANPAPWTILAMWILSGGLVRTGVLTVVSGFIGRHAAGRPWTMMGLLGVLTVAASAFVNNTPIVVVGIPIALQLARTIGYAPSKLMIPLSYLAIVGGLCSLIGTSTNLVVDGVARGAGLAPFSLFEITPLGICLAAIAFAYLRLAIPLLLPDRDPADDLLAAAGATGYFTEVMIPAGSPLVGRRVLDVTIFARDEMQVIDVLRQDESLRTRLAEVVLAAGDRVVIRSSMQELLGLRRADEVILANRVASTRSVTVKALVAPDCALAGRTLGALRLRRRYGVYPLAVQRRNRELGRQLEEVVVRVGDTLLLEGAPRDIRRLADEAGLVNVTLPAERPYRRRQAPLMLAVLAAVVAMEAFGIMPIHASALIGVAFVLVSGILEPDEAFSLVDPRLMALILAMLVIGVAMDRSGAVELVVGWIAPYLAGRPPTAALVAVYVLTVVLTELLSNNAVGVLMTPVAITLATSLGIDPRPLVVAVMVGASAGFTTPIGYQTNLLVYGPGGYRFRDYFRIGMPMTVLYGVTACLLIPVFWDLGGAAAPVP